MVKWTEITLNVHACLIIEYFVIFSYRLKLFYLKNHTNYCCLILLLYATQAWKELRILWKNWNLEYKNNKIFIKFQRNRSILFVTSPSVKVLEKSFTLSLPRSFSQWSIGFMVKVLELLKIEVCCWNSESKNQR